MTKILSIEGNIGSGKSSFVKVLTEYYKKTDKLNKLKIYFLEEPVNIWETIQNEKQENIIECFYRDQEKYAFSFQMMAYISRLSLLRKAMEKGYNYILTERCVNTDRNVFAKMLYDSGKIEKINYEIYIKLFDEFIEEFNNFHYIYIKTDPNIALERVNKRARTGESIPLAYLVVCDHYHNNWLDQTRQLTILDGNINRENNYNDWIKIIDDLINTSSNIPEIISSGSLEKWFDH